MRYVVPALVALAACQCAAPVKTLDHGIVWDETAKPRAEQAAIDAALDTWNKHYRTRYEPRPDVRWVDGPIKWRGNYYYGIMWNCDHVYVQFSQIEGAVCGSALVHELGHCFRQRAGWGGDAKHADKEFWGAGGLVERAHLNACVAEVNLLGGKVDVQVNTD